MVGGLDGVTRVFKSAHVLTLIAADSNLLITLCHANKYAFASHTTELKELKGVSLNPDQCTLSFLADIFDSVIFFSPNGDL